MPDTQTLSRLTPDIFCFFNLTDGFIKCIIKHQKGVVYEFCKRNSRCSRFLQCLCMLGLTKTYVTRLNPYLQVLLPVQLRQESYLNNVIDSTKLSGLQITGSGNVSVSATSGGVLTINGTATDISGKLNYPTFGWTSALDPASHHIIYWKDTQHTLDSGYKIDKVVVLDTSYNSTNQNLALIKTAAGLNGETIIADSGITRTQLLDVINGGGGGGLTISGTVGNLVAVGSTSTQITGTTIVANNVVQKGTTFTANQVVVAETATAPVKIKNYGNYDYCAKRCNRQYKQLYY